MNVYRETPKTLATRRRKASLKSWRTRKRMQTVRAKEKQRRDDEFAAEHGLFRPLGKAP